MENAASDQRFSWSSCREYVLHFYLALNRHHSCHSVCVHTSSTPGTLGVRTAAIRPASRPASLLRYRTGLVRASELSGELTRVAPLHRVTFRWNIFILPIHHLAHTYCSSPFHWRALNRKIHAFCYSSQATTYTARLKLHTLGCASMSRSLRDLETPLQRPWRTRKDDISLSSRADQCHGEQ